MRHPQLQARKPLADPPALAEVFERILPQRLLAIDGRSSARIGLVILGDQRAEYVVDFANSMVRGGHEWQVASEDPDLDVLVQVEAQALVAAMTKGSPPELTIVRGERAALAPLVALLRSASA